MSDLTLLPRIDVGELGKGGWYVAAGAIGASVGLMLYLSGLLPR